MEYVDGKDIYEILRAEKIDQLSEKRAAKYIKDIIEALEYCHSIDIIHRDVKLENIVINEKDEAKLVDFGFAIELKKGETTREQCGTLEYLSPEIILGKTYRESVDIWCIGVLMYEMICGISPFYDEELIELYRNIEGLDYTIPQFVSEEARELISRILVLDKNDRLTISEIKMHKWLNND